MLLLAAMAVTGVPKLTAATRIDDPKSFVSGVYAKFIAAQTSHASYLPPDDIYTARLSKLLRDDRRKAKGEVGCLEFVFWTNGQDWKISDLAVASTNEGSEKQTVIAKFLNLGHPQEIHVEFRREAKRWQLDDVRSALDRKWTLSEILKCTY